MPVCVHLPSTFQAQLLLDRQRLNRWVNKVQKEEIFVKLKEILVSHFGIEPSLIVSEALLNEDLDIDSIDAVDLIVNIKNHISAPIRPEIFKSARSIEDVVNEVHLALNT